MIYSRPGHVRLGFTPGGELMRFSKIMSLCFVAVLACASVLMAAEVNWQPMDFQSASARARQEGKLVYIFVEGSNCPPCESFKFSHLNDEVYSDFINTAFVPIRAHEGYPEGKAFLQSLRLNHGAVPRFYVLTPEGRGVSMSVGMVSAPPIGAVDVLKMATGNPLPVNQNSMAQLGQRIRSYTANQRSAGSLYADGTNREVAYAAIEAWSWALAGRLDEAERAWGREWAGRLGDQDLRYKYVNFWSKWNRNGDAALQVAQEYQRSSPSDPAGGYLMGMALAANGRYEEALRIGENLMGMDPSNSAIQREVDKWRSMAGMSSGSMLYYR